MKYCYSIIFLLILGCTSKWETSKCIKIFNPFLRGSNSNDVDSYFRVINYLDNSNIDSAKILFTEENSPTIRFHNGYLYYSVDDSIYANQIIPSYCSFRIAEFTGDLDKNILTNILIPAGNLDDNECINNLIEIEYAYLKCYISNNKNYIDSFKLKTKAIASYNRIKYLYANLLYDFKSKKEAARIYLNLLNENYYQLPILKKLIEFYSLNTDQDSLKYYNDYFSTHFPTICNPVILKQHIIENNQQGFLVEFNKKKYSQKDSIISRTLLARFKLIHTNDSLEAIYENYKQANRQFILDSIKIWEKGEYYDIMLRYYFKNRKYNSVYNFLNMEVGYNKKILIENEKDLFTLISKYYLEYINENPTIDEISGFYNKEIIKNRKLPILEKQL